MTALGDFSPGDVLTAADINAIGTWQDYTPSLTNISGSVAYATFCKINELVIVHFALTLDAATTGQIEISTPVDYGTDLGGTGNGQNAIGTAYGVDASDSNRRYLMFVQARGTNGFRFFIDGASTGSASLADVNTPFVWASGDSLRFTATYKGA